MISRQAPPPGTSLPRGGERITLVKAPDRFTARAKSGVSPAVLAASVGADSIERMERQNLDVLVVPPERRDEAMAALREGEQVDFASHVYSIEGDPTARLYLTDELTVQFKPEVGDDAIEALAEQHGLQIVKAVQGLPHAFVMRVTSQASENPIKIANRLLERDDVLLAEPNVVVAAQSFYTPSDTLFGEQWHLFNSGGPDLDPASHIDAPGAWSVTRGVRDVIIAVADDSCDLSHHDFSGDGKIVAPRDFAGRDFAPLPEASDDNHGTACCGVVAAEENGEGVVGVAPGCALMPIRTSGMLDDGSIEELFGWASDHNAAVISCSWGASAIRFPLSARQSAALHRCATAGRDGRGCVIVFAAGNANRPVNGSVDEQGWPGNLFKGPTEWHGGYAAHPDVIAVSAITSRARKSAYSNWGEEISVCAPSNNAHPGFYHPAQGHMRTYPQIVGPLPGRGIVTTDRVGPSGYSGTDYTRTFGGTSSACPVVAGVAGLVLSANPSLTAQQVRAIIEGTADKIEDPATDLQLGNAYGSYDSRGHSKWFGYGRVNALKAVTKARGSVEPVAEPLHRRSEPGLPIPDNSPAGVQDSVVFDEEARAAGVAVRVAIRHSYVGDLRVVLTAPSGASAVLHDRGGGNADDLRRSYDAGTPAILALKGEQVRGSWTLTVQDLALQDTGVLESWELDIVPEAGARNEHEDVVGQVIPDNTPAGITRTIELADDGTVVAIEVEIDITHSYIGDLRVTLSAPDGRVATLHAGTGGSRDNLRATYGSASLAELRALCGQPARGGWQLRVVDGAPADVGKLNRWSLCITTADAPAEPTVAQRASAAGEQPADFRQIKGIGPGIERVLHRAGIVRYRQLAAQSPESLLQLLGHLAGMSAERIARERWLEKAQLLAESERQREELVDRLPDVQAAVLDGPDALVSPAAAGERLPATADDDRPEARQHYATFTVELLLDEDDEVRRTRVVHVQENQQDTWRGWQDGRLVRFFIERSALRQPGDSGVEAAGPVATGGEEARVELETGDLSLEQVPDGSDAEGHEHSHLRARVGFRLSGQEAARLTYTQESYFVHFLAYVLETGQTNVLASKQGQFLPGVQEYEALLEFAPPAAGRYQILATVVLPEQGAVGSSVGPKLRVE